MSEFQRTRDEGCLSDLRLDRLLRDELTVENAAEARAHLASCPKCGARSSELAAARAQHQASSPPLAPRAAGGTAPAGRRRRIWTAVAAATLAAAGLLFALRPGERDGTRDTRLKGGAGFGFYVQHDGRLRRASDGEIVAPGDTLQLVYSSATPFYGAVLSRDGSGRVSRYFPDGDRAEPLPAGSARSLPRSTLLDDVLGQETLVTLICADAALLPPLEAALARGQTPAAPGCKIERFTVEKRKQ